MLAIKNGMTINKVRPDLAKELLDPEDGDRYHYGSVSSVAWKCAEGHVWEVSPNSRVNFNSGCPFCSNRRVWKGFNDIHTTNPELGKELRDPEDGFKYGQHSNSKVWWVCAKGHEWDAQINSRSKGAGCAVCDGKRILKGYNDLETTDPILYSELTDKSLLLSRGHGKKVSWTCKAGHQWESTPNNRSYRARGCPFCDKYQTSRAEIALREMLRDIGFDVNIDHTHRIDVTGWSRKTAQVDVVFEYESLPFVIEYDGAYWHHQKRDKDLQKSLMLLDNGYHVVRIAGQTQCQTLDPLPIDDPRFLSLEVTHCRDITLQMEAVVRKISDWVYDLTQTTVKD